MNKKLLLALFLGAGTAFNASAQEVAYASVFESMDAMNGWVTKFNPQNLAAGQTTVLQQEMFEFVQAATGADGKYYALTFNFMGSGTTLSSFNFNDGEISKIGDLPYDITINDLTYDSKSKTVYGIYSDGTKATLYTVGTSDAKVTEVATYANAPELFGLAADKDGNLVALGRNGDDLCLFKISADKKECTVSTILPKDYVTTFGSNTQDIEFYGDKLYWLANAQVNRASGSPTFRKFLGTIDQTSGEVKDLGEFENAMVGLTFENTNAGGGGTEEPVESPTKVQVVYTLGNALGDGDESKPSKAEVSYYGKDNQLLRVVNNNVDASGAFSPYQYSYYDYNDKGQLSMVRRKEKGVKSAYDIVWGVTDTISTYKYADDGSMTDFIQSGARYEYKWDGKNLVEEKKYSAYSGNLLKTTTYSDFIEGATNLPKKAFYTGKSSSNQGIIEYTYDKDNHLVEAIDYKMEATKMDENGVPTDGVKADPRKKEVWTYENGVLKLYESLKWKADANEGKGDFVENSKKEYTTSEKGDSVTVVGFTKYGEKWTKSGNPSVTVTTTFSGAVAPQNLVVSDVEGKINTVSLTCEAPAAAPFNAVYKVFRNGEHIGDAQLVDGKLTYEDSEVANGEWEYFVQYATEDDEMGKNISNPVEKVFNTTLTAVKDIKAVVSTKDNMFVVNVSWTAPETDMKVLGYNIYNNVKSYTKNPVPDNYTDLILDTHYDYTEWAVADYEGEEKNFIVEAVYNIGKIKSEPYKVVLKKETADAIGTIEAAGNLTINGNNISANGNGIEVYSANGSLVSRTSGSELSLEGLQKGVYVVKVLGNGTAKAVKLLKK